MTTIVETGINSKGHRCICRGCKACHVIIAILSRVTRKRFFFFAGVKQQQYEDDQGPLAYGQPRFRPDYNTPEGFRAGEEMKDKMDVEWKELRRMDMMSKGLENPNKAYTEGGLVFLPRKGINANGDELTILINTIMI